jgi:signal transduction histidine kinase
MMIRSITHHALEALCTQAREAIIVTDRQGCIALLNQAAEAALGLRARDAVGRALSDYAVLQPLASLLKDANSSQGAIWANLHGESGEPVPVHVIELCAEVALSPADELIDGLVHDLKLPVTAAKGFIDVIVGMGGLSNQQINFANRASLKMVTMSEAINEVIDTFWMDASGQLNPQQTDLVPILTKIVREANDFARLRGVSIELSHPQDGCTILADATRIRGAMTNLVSNAIKYSLNGGTVRITLRQEKDTVTFEVADQGIGIAQEDLARIFERGYRVNSEQTKGVEGTGVGLTIVSTVIAKHGGRVFVRSTPGEGSVFGFTVPVA